MEKSKYLTMLKTATAVKTNSKKGGTEVISVSITNHVNGKRLTLSKALYSCLGQPKTLQFAVNSNENVLIIGEKLMDEEVSYRVSNKTRGIVYNASLVEFVTEEFNLDFSEVSSMTFRNITLDGAYVIIEHSN